MMHIPLSVKSNMNILNDYALELASSNEKMFMCNLIESTFYYLNLQLFLSTILSLIVSMLSLNKKKNRQHLDTNSSMLTVIINHDFQIFSLFLVLCNKVFLSVVHVTWHEISILRVN